ncbi:MAG TPA: DUF3592 domain-containing protein [Vicinamibacterales bacterium]
MEGSIFGSLGSGCLVPLLFLVAIVVVLLRRGLQWKLLLQDGVETTGTVVKKQIFRNLDYRIRYQYVDQTGRTHSHRSAVTDEVYHGCEEGGPFPVVYSRSKPHISAPKYLIDQSRAAMEKKRASGGPATS